MIFEENEFYERLSAISAEAGFSDLALPAREKLYAITRRLDECCKKFNLTAITEPDEVLKKHIADSLFAAREIARRARPGDTVLDVGSGAGFPALPTAACLPELGVFALDSTAKKVSYMNETAAQAGIHNFSAFTARAEEAARTKARESYGFVTARAVARLNVLCELCLPFVAVGGKFIAMKGAAAVEEAEEAKRASELLGASFDEIIPCDIPGLPDKRFLIVYTKKSPSPAAYPRNFSQISKKPL